MEKLRERHGLAAVLAALRILMIRCRARPLSRTLSEEMAAERARLVERRDAWELARDERMAATCELNYCDLTLDGAVMTLSRNAVALVDGDTSDARYARLFPVAPSRAMRPVGGREQSVYVDAMLHTLEHEPKLEALRAHRKPIAKAQRSLADAQAERDRLQGVENRAANELTLALAAARTAYNQSFHRLHVLFPEDEAFVESCFRALAPSRASEHDAQPDEPEEPATPVVAAAPVRSPSIAPAQPRDAVARTRAVARRKRR